MRLRGGPKSGEFEHAGFDVDRPAITLVLSLWKATRVNLCKLLQQC